MSLTVARMANLFQARSIVRLACIAGSGLICTSSAVFSQENLLRDSDAAQNRSAEDSKATGDVPKAGLDIVSQKPEDKEALETRNSSGVGPKASREPLVLPTLGIPNTSIKGIGTGATPEDMVAGRLPAMVQLPFGQNRYGYWPLESKTWIAPVFCHQPTYFEDVMLERHGHEMTPAFQPLVSGTRFMWDAFLMPYNAYLNPPLKDISSAGYYRPGSSAPLLRQRPTYEKGALRLQILTTGTGVLALQP